MTQWPIIISARLERGKMVLDREHLRAMLSGAKDCQLTVTIERQHATRSPAQNAWYWGQVLALISEHTGYTVDEVHELMKAKFNATPVTFSEYCEQIRMWAAQDLGVYIPDPDPNWRQNEEAV